MVENSINHHNPHPLSTVKSVLKRSPLGQRKSGLIRHVAS